MQKLDREKPHSINVHQSDYLELWPHIGTNLTLKNGGGNDVLRIYGISYDQLAALYLEIARVLGKPPEPTVHHLQQVHESIGKLIQTNQKPEADDIGDIPTSVSF